MDALSQSDSVSRFCGLLRDLGTCRETRFLLTITALSSIERSNENSIGLAFSALIAYANVHRSSGPMITGISLLFLVSIPLMKNFPHSFRKPDTGSKSASLCLIIRQENSRSLGGPTNMTGYG